MTDPSRFKSVLLANVPGLRALAMCLLPERTEADDLVEKVLMAAWTEHPHHETAKLRIGLFMLLCREFRSFEHARTLDFDPRAKKVLIRSSRRRAGAAGSSFGTRLHGLPATEREALLLVGVCNLSYTEAAAICGCDIATVKRRIESACDHLSDGMVPFQIQSKSWIHLWQVC